MKLRNPFSEKTRWLFFDIRYICVDCGGNGQNCGGMSLHHIFGRCSSSPYNACWLCGNCHSKIGHSFDEEKPLLVKTKSYLDSIGYEPDESDLAFLEGNKKYYDKSV